MFNTPILFLIFNRPDTTQKVFDEIKKQKPKYLFVAADGYRKNKEGEKKICEETRNIINQVDRDCEVKTLFREKNLGCKIAVSEAITRFFDQVEQGIILEDDCLPDQSFFGFCENMLEKYKYDNRIMCIAGSNFYKEEYGNNKYFFSTSCPIWGWATWKRCRNLYDLDMVHLNSFLNNKVLEYMVPKYVDREGFRKVCLDVKYNHLDTWDAQWTYTVLSNNGLCLIPGTNLISNIGFSNEATHTKLNLGTANLKCGSLDLSRLIHPELIVPNFKEMEKKTLNEKGIYKLFHILNLILSLFGLKGIIKKIFKL